MYRLFLVSLGSAAMGATIMPASAHHSYAEFDRSQMAEITGTVKEWAWKNPHSWLYVIAEGPDGTPDAEWAIETGSAANMSRIPGWSRTMMKPGDEVTIVLNPRRDGGAGGNLLSVSLPDGNTVSLMRGPRESADDESSERDTD